MQAIDYLILLSYIAIIFLIAFISKKNNQLNFKGQNVAEAHFLASRNLSFWRCLFSVMATEASAVSFLLLPSLCFKGDFSPLKYSIGAILGRFIVVHYLMPHFASKDMTVFDALFRDSRKGLNTRRIDQELESESDSDSVSGRRIISFSYIFWKIFGIGARLAAGGSILSSLLGTDIFQTMIVISLVTYSYVMIGGLRAVVNTDCFQLLILVLGCILTHHLIGEYSTENWGELMSAAYQGGKFGISEGLIGVLLGIISGSISSITTHGVDPEITQKFFACGNDLDNSKKMYVWAAIGSFFIDVLLLSMGAILWAFYQKTAPPDNFDDRGVYAYFILNHFPSPFKGFIVVSLLAAIMSTLDSSLNALGTVFFNDVIYDRKEEHFRKYMRLDAFAITIWVLIIGCIVSQTETLLNAGMIFSHWSAAPLLGLFIAKFLLHKYIKFNVSITLVLGAYLFGFLGMSIHHLVFNVVVAPLTVTTGVVSTLAFLWFFTWIAKQDKDYFWEDK